MAMAGAGAGEGSENNPLDHDEQGIPLDAEDQLILSEEDEPLPWLEASDDYEEAADDSGRMVVIGLLGLLGVAVLLGALYWLFRDRPDGNMVADGSTIEAPEGPYKERPEDAGGRQVEGTGDTSFQVAEGQTREGQIAGSGATRPSISRDQASSTAGAGAVTGAGSGASAGSAGATGTPAIAAGSVGVQVGAYSNRTSAEAGWSQLAGRYTALQGVSHRIVEGTADSGKIYRLQAVASSGAAADTMCQSMRAAGGDCQVKR